MLLLSLCKHYFYYYHTIIILTTAQVFCAVNEEDLELRQKEKEEKRANFFTQIPILLFPCFLLLRRGSCVVSIVVGLRQRYSTSKQCTKKNNSFFSNMQCFSIVLFASLPFVLLLIIMSLILLHINLQKAVPERTSLSTSHKLKQHQVILLLQRK